MDTTRLIPLTWVINAFGGSPDVPLGAPTGPWPNRDSYRVVPTDNSYKPIAVSCSVQGLMAKTPAATFYVYMPDVLSGGIPLDLLTTAQTNQVQTIDIEDGQDAFLDETGTVTLPAGALIGVQIHETDRTFKILATGLEITLWIEPNIIPDPGDLIDGNYESLTWRLDSAFAGIGNTWETPFLDSLRLVQANKRVVGIAVSFLTPPRTANVWLALVFGTGAKINRTIYAPLRVPSCTGEGLYYILNRNTHSFTNEYIPALSSVGLVQLAQGSASTSIVSSVAENIDVTLYLEDTGVIPTENADLIKLSWTPDTIDTPLSVPFQCTPYMVSATGQLQGGVGLWFWLRSSTFEIVNTPFVPGLGCLLVPNTNLYYACSNLNITMMLYTGVPHPTGIIPTGEYLHLAGSPWGDGEFTLWLRRV